MRIEMKKRVFHLKDIAKKRVGIEGNYAFLKRENQEESILKVVISNKGK